MNIKDVEVMISNAIYNASKRVFSYITWCLVVGSFGYLAAAYFLGALDKDSTDSPTSRSGMELHVDHLTGCHYLSRKGGLTPRLEANGKQYGCYDNG